MKIFTNPLKFVFGSILCLSLGSINLFAAAVLEKEVIAPEPIVKADTELLFFQPNTTPLFLELYEAYGLSDLPSNIQFDDSIYLDQSTPITILPMQPSNQIVFEKASSILSSFHKKMGDFELYVDPAKPKPFFYTASGSKHLIVALVYAIVTTEPHKKFVFAEKAPFYSGHPSAVTGIFTYPNARFLAFHDASEIVLEPDEVLVEFVTSPNNPDGVFRKPFTDASILIADFVFASSAFGSDETGYRKENLEWVKEAREKGKHIFSFNSASKQFGKTGSRTGYIWYPLYDTYAESIFKKFFGFISASTVAGGTTGLASFLDLIEAILNTPDAGEALRRDAKKSLSERHKLLEKEFLQRYPGSTVVSVPGSPTFFARVADKRIPQKNASEVILEDLKISVNNGDTMGETNAFVRINVSGYSDLFVRLLNRLAKQEKYTKEDVFFYSRKEPAINN